MTKEYFEDHERKFVVLQHIAEIYRRKAMFYNRLYKVTKIKWAKDKNRYYVEEGTKLLAGGLCVALADMAILDKIIKEGGE